MLYSLEDNASRQERSCRKSHKKIKERWEEGRGRQWGKRIILTDSVGDRRVGLQAGEWRHDHVSHSTNQRRLKHGCCFSSVWRRHISKSCVTAVSLLWQPNCQWRHA